MVASTHVHAGNVDGDTLLHDIYNHVLCKERVLIIDEASMVPLRLWGVISNLKCVGCRIIGLGDFVGQLCPIPDQRRMGLWKKLPSSDAMHDICNGLHIKVQKFRGGDDDAHFKFVGSIYTGIDSDEDALRDQAVKAARERYPNHKARASGHHVFDNHEPTQNCNECSTKCISRTSRRDFCTV